MKCTARRVLQFEPRMTQSTGCWREAGHSGPHKTMILDHDGNPIPYRWQDPTPHGRQNPMSEQADGFPGNPWYLHPDNAETGDGRTIAAALLTLAFELRTANLLAYKAVVGETIGQKTGERLGL